jgi:acetyl esterase/lipase
LKKYVVVSINHRLAPQNSIVDQLIDVKRAIRWTKQNIGTFGGDPNFIAICGSSSGAHLATMATMTANLAEYQPGFEDVDTTVNACVSLSGFYDVTRNWGYKFNQKFDRRVVGQTDSDIGRQFSPTWRLREAEANKARVAATDEEKLGPNLPPFLVIQ